MALFQDWLSRYREKQTLLPSLDVEATNEKIAQAIESKKPYLIGRLGWIEGYIIGKWKAGHFSSPELREKLSATTGFFPPTLEEFKIFSDIYLKSIATANLLGLLDAPFHGWLIKRYGNNPLLCSLGALEPYFSNNPWSSALADKKILVIHPFAESIQRQYETAQDKLFTNKNVLPKFELKTVKSPQTIPGNVTEYSSWSETLEVLKKEIETISFDVAILGCGAYGLPLGAMIKEMGKIAVHLGGATQLLFGVSGARWRKDPNFQSIITDAWTPPLESERPAGWEKIEKGCYW